jgi:hypothetical protein
MWEKAKNIVDTFQKEWEGKSLEEIKAKIRELGALIDGDKLSREGWKLLEFLIEKLPDNNIPFTKRH